MVTQHYRWDFIGLSSYDKPTPETSEKVVDGSTYYEADTSKLYIFYNDTWYEKTATGGGGGGDITVVQTTGDSTTDVMSQKAVTDMIAPQNSDNAIWINNPKGLNTLPATLSNYSVTINPTTSGTGGGGANATSAIAINGTASGHSAISIGVNSSATQRGSIALGRGASATSVGEMNIGTNDTTAGYNSTNYRLLSGVHYPVNAHDAVNKEYVDTYIENSMIIKPITNFDYNFDSTDPTNTDPDPEDCNSWALWKFPSMGVAFLSYENGLGYDIYIQGGSNPQNITNMMGGEAAIAGFTVVAELNGVVNTAIYGATGQMGPFYTDPSTGEPV